MPRDNETTNQDPALTHGATDPGPGTPPRQTTPTPPHSTKPARAASEGTPPATRAVGPAAPSVTDHAPPDRGLGVPITPLGEGETAVPGPEDALAAVPAGPQMITQPATAPRGDYTGRYGPADYTPYEARKDERTGAITLVAQIPAPPPGPGTPTAKPASEAPASEATPE